MLVNQSALAEGTCFLDAKLLKKSHESDWSFLSVEVQKIIGGPGNGECGELKRKLPEKSKLRIGPIDREAAAPLKTGKSVTFETICTRGFSIETNTSTHGCENWKLTSKKN